MKRVIIRGKEIKGNCTVFKGGEKMVIEGAEINLKEIDKICVHALASLFFQPFTVPNKEFAEELLKDGHSIGLHAVHTKDCTDFSSDLRVRFMDLQSMALEKGG
ncbi:MAG: hypothetical protein SYNGOMJ08_00558 [Candidatus Syntrophoarchaeum sp. GoM_oil]|nr:MAG: hypothetical protein SYNGOMJ08_00558 [Candidatus Syntrophoarchaeum sp. GoM_oil]